MNIHYRIDFFSDWHCGSGLSAGVDLDALVVKDKNELPFIPGKTIKGLVREAVEELARLSENVLVDDGNVAKENVQVSEQEQADKLKKEFDPIKKAFGFFKKDNNNLEIEVEKGKCFFSNATIPHALANVVISEKTAKYFYRTISSTKINENGVAEEHSLRKIQVTIPCSLEGDILHVPDEMVETLKEGLKFIKRLGLNRNRGLGRCRIEVI